MTDRHAGDTAEVIVVIDDDEAVRDSLKILLETDRFEVVTFASGEEFLDALPGSSVACLLLDVHLPGISGFNLLQHLVASDFRRPIILMTGRPSESLLPDAVKAGARTVLFKPLDENRLFETLDHSLERQNNRCLVRSPD